MSLFYHNIKLLCILVSIFHLGHSAFGQNYQYTLKLDQNDKMSLSNITSEINSSNRYITDSSIIFESSMLLEESYFDNLASQYSYTLNSFSRSRTFNEHTISEKAGNDCPDAEIICSDASFSANSSGPGTQELNTTNDGCLLGLENESAWYYVNINADGTLELDIVPDAPADYDFALWGPYTSSTASANCPPTTAPIRCNFASPCNDMGVSVYTTGLDCTAANNSEGSMGDCQSNCINATAGDVYILLIDNFTASGVDYTVNFSGSAGLGCTPVTLPVELGEFNAVARDGYNEITWMTHSESNNDYFILQKSSDAINWRNLKYISGAGNSTSKQFYSVVDDDVGNDELLYYRLKQVDYDGSETTFEIRSVSTKNVVKIIKKTNMLGQEVGSDYSGIVIEHFSDGTYRKRYQH